MTDDRGTTTWADLSARSARLATALRERGLVPGDTVVTVLGNQCEFMEVSLACCVGGFVLVPLNWHWVASEIAYVLEDAQAAAVVVDRRWADVVVAALDQVSGSGDAAGDPSVTVRARLLVDDIPGVVTGTARPIDAAERFESYEQVLAYTPSRVLRDPIKGGPMFYTSGTTGQPKGVRSSLTSVGGPADMFILMAHSMGPTLGVQPGVTRMDGSLAVQLICGPMYHSAQWVFAMFTLLCGASLVLQHHFDASGLLDLVDEHGVTNLHLVPTQMSRILGLSEERRRAFSGATMGRVLHGAAPCPPSVKRGLIEWWGPIVSEYYGGTEGGFISIIDATEWSERPTSVGRPLPFIELSILDANGDPVPSGTTGEVWFRNILGSDFEYHNAPDKTSSAHRGDGLGTLGDVGFVDTDGYLHLADRKIDMIVSGGVNIYPAEIEGVLAAHDAIVDVAVFGIPDDEMGEKVHAAVVLAPGAGLDDLLRSALDEWCRERMAGYKRPRSYEVLDTLPRSEVGKILKRDLRDRWWKDRPRFI